MSGLVNIAEDVYTIHGYGCVWFQVFSTLMLSLINYFVLSGSLSNAELFLFSSEWVVFCSMIPDCSKRACFVVRYQIAPKGYSLAPVLFITSHLARD